MNPSHRAVQLLHQAARLLDLVELHDGVDMGVQRLLAAAEAKISEAVALLLIADDD